MSKPLPAGAKLGEFEIVECMSSSSDGYTYKASLRGNLYTVRVAHSERGGLEVEELTTTSGPLQFGDRVASFQIVRELSKDDWGTTYLVRRDQKRFLLKVGSHRFDEIPAEVMWRGFLEPRGQLLAFGRHPIPDGFPYVVVDVPDDAELPGDA
jgi:hypothetical protein